MLSKIAILGFIGSAAAFNAPVMTVRREAIAIGAGAAVVAPILRPAQAAGLKDKSFNTPIVEIFDERDGCAGPRKPPFSKADGEEGLCVKVSMQHINFGTNGQDRIGAAAKDVFVNYKVQRGI